MTNGNFISLGEVMWRVMKNPLAAELSFNDAAEFALEFIRLLGAPVAYTDNLKTIELVNYKAQMPQNLLYVNGIRYLDVTEDGKPNKPIAMRESTNVYHLNEVEHSLEQNTDFDLRGNHRRNEFTYKLQNGIVFTSMRDGCIEVAYKGIAIDDDGFPLIPDNEKVMIGMEYYILSRYLEGLWMMGKITDKVFDFIQQKRYFYMPSAFTSLTMPSVDGMESLMNSLNRLIISTTSHKNFFKKMGEQESIRKFR